MGIQSFSFAVKDLLSNRPHLSWLCLRIGTQTLLWAGDLDVCPVP
jgi:hypothetical protein